ncbi:MAG: hypothetical protein P4L84_28855 [Isosphaeraceae bacterium]|nr:hypothetical protein [Isosphaeraceae bacterium]
MRIEGAILPASDGSRVNREAWCRLIDGRPEFRRPQPRQAINPFTRGPMVIRPTPDIAEVVIDGVVVGNVYWSTCEDHPLVNVSAERSALTLVLQWAAELGGEFGEHRSLAEEDA